MMVHLSEFSVAQIIQALPPRFKCDGDIAQKVYTHFDRLDLRYDVDRGHTYDNELGLKAAFSSKKDIPKYSGRHDLDLLHDAFMPDINNGVSRFKRGLKL